LGSLVDPQNQDQRTKTEVQEHRTDLTVRGPGLTGVQQHSPESSKWMTPIEIARLASWLSKFTIAEHPSDGATTKFTKGPSGACILVLGLRGSFVFRLPPYNPSGERMAAASWNHRSFCFAIFPNLFSLGFVGLA
jgi:hypothetical protein